MYKRDSLEINLYRIPILCILVSFDMLYGISMREQNETKSPMEVTAIIVKAFTKNKDAGNPAGVILDADHLTDAQMQSVATELGFSESVFILKSDVADCRMRYFTVTQEVDYCAHASLAAGFVYLPKSSLLFYETKAGFFTLTRDDEEFITMQQKSPEFGALVQDPFIADILGIDVEDIDDGHMPEVVSTGVPKLIVGVKSLKVLLGIKPDFERIKQLCRAIGARGVYVFTGETVLISSDFHARQFNPLCGINEDPVTGIAAGALGAYLSNEEEEDQSVDTVVEQGYSMDKFGTMRVIVENKAVSVSGQAVIYGERVLTV